MPACPNNRDSRAFPRLRQRGNRFLCCPLRASPLGHNVFNAQFFVWIGREELAQAFAHIWPVFIDAQAHCWDEIAHRLERNVVVHVIKARACALICGTIVRATWAISVATGWSWRGLLALLALCALSLLILGLDRSTEELATVSGRLDPAINEKLFAVNVQRAGPVGAALVFLLVVEEEGETVGIVVLGHDLSDDDCNDCDGREAHSRSG